MIYHIVYLEFIEIVHHDNDMMSSSFEILTVYLLLHESKISVRKARLPPVISRLLQLYYKHTVRHKPLAIGENKHTIDANPGFSHTYHHVIIDLT